MSEELSIMEDRGIDPAVWSALSSSIFPGAEDQSIAMAWDYCKARDLDVMKKPCHIVPMNVKDAKTGKYSWRDVIMPGIADHRITAFRTGEFAGMSEPEFGPEVEMNLGGVKITAPGWCQITVYRLMGGEKRAFPHREYFDEAYGRKKDLTPNAMWTTRKRGQLAKCAEAGALRKGFPEELGGLMTVDEVGEVRDVTPQRGKLGTDEERDAPQENPFGKIGTAENERSSPIGESQSDAHEEPEPEGATSTSGSTPKERPEGNLIEVTFIEKRTQKGETKGKKWTRYGFHLALGEEQVWAGTFSGSLGKLAFQEGSQVMVILAKKDEGRYDLLWIEEAPAKKGGLV